MRFVQSADEPSARTRPPGRGRGGLLGRLYLEKALVPARHVEIQVLCDQDGGVLTLGERECSIQRRHQKLVEESPSPPSTTATREAMEAATERACRTIGYENAGIVRVPARRRRDLHFMELNARLQVEHPVSELVTGVDIVREQLRLAAGSGSRRPAARLAAGMRSRFGSTPRTSPAVRTGAGNDRALPAAARPRHPDRHAPGAGIDDSPTTTL